MISCIHDIVAVGIFPPAPAKITRVAGAVLSLSIFDLLEPTFKGQGVFHHEGIEV